MRPPSLQTLMRGGAGGDAKVALVSVGTKPVVAAFEVGPLPRQALGYEFSLTLVRRS